MSDNLGPASGAEETLPHVDIILVNWNSHVDTLECLESVFRLDYPKYRVIVCDNASHDDSIRRIEDWSRDCTVVKPASGQYESLFLTPRSKSPIVNTRYSREEAESVPLGIVDAPLVLIDTGGNLGFAGGNNVGLRYSCRQGDAQFVWLLNTDTVVRPDSLTHLVQRAMLDNRIGMVGSKLVHYWTPSTVQALGGGSFDLRSTRTTHLGAGLNVSDTTPSADTIEASMSYVIGASMLVSKSFIQDVGLMCEDYFLYYEELDWAVRGRRRYQIAYAAESIVYHKVGGSSSKVASVGALRFIYRNRLKFVARHFPSRFRFTILSLLWEMLRHILRGRLSQASLIFSALLAADNLHRQGRARANHKWL